jgi:hypothetical protein
MSVTVLLGEKTSSAKKPPICRSIVTVFVASAHHHVKIGINLTDCSGDLDDKGITLLLILFSINSIDLLLKAYFTHIKLRLTYI